MSDWLNTRIEQKTRSGGNNTQLETGGSGSSTQTSTSNATETSTPSIIANGSRVASNEIDTPGTQIVKSHYALQLSFEIPFQNRQPL